MKSVLISHRYFPPQVGGITRMIERIARELGPDRVCCLTGLPMEPGLNGHPDNPRVYRSPGMFLGKTRIARATGWVNTIPRMMLRERPKAMLLATIADARYGMRLKGLFGLSTVTLVHGNEVLDILRELPLNSPSVRALRSSDRVIAVSQFTRGLAERAGVSPDRINVVHPGCDAKEFSPRTPDPGRRSRVLGPRHQDRVILTTGNLVARKGHDMVIRALPRLLETTPDLTYLIVGDGPYRDELHRVTREIGVQDRVVFAGQVTDKELPDYYALCDVFVMASRARTAECDVEGFGIVYLEANACGKPVVAGRAGGAPEAIIQGETGLLADPDDPGDIADALLQLLANPVQARRLGEQGRARVIREFAWAQVVDRIHAIMTLTLAVLCWIR